MRLQRDVVIRTALELLNEVGMEGLTTCKLAERLGVQSPALYWHFKNKRALLEEMAAQMMAAEPKLADPEPLDAWPEWVAERGRSFRRALLAYRDGARVHAGTRPDPTQFTDIEAHAAVLARVGFSPDSALRALLAVGRYVLGWVIEEQAGAEDDAARGVDAFAPDGTRYPVLARGLALMRASDPDADFEFGLRALVAGFTDVLHEEQL